MNNQIVRAFLQHLVSFFLVMTLFDLGFNEGIQWIRNVLSAVVFALLMIYFRSR